uniref:Uncharacterized protein n=1 Tax=Zea mays TaxID=4577 RepID=B4FV99_MAIZE|nr:unknown [Zea mays]
MVCAPDSATRSVRFSPRSEKLCSRPAKPAKGDGSAPVLDASDTVPSRRPVSTCHSDALNWYDTASRAASATMSAHDTTPGHALSSCALIASITSYPPTDRFGAAVFSLCAVSSRIDASQPCVRSSWWSVAGWGHGVGDRRTTDATRTGRGTNAPPSLPSPPLPNRHPSRPPYGRAGSGGAK